MPIVQIKEMPSVVPPASGDLFAVQRADDTYGHIDWDDITAAIGGMAAGADTHVQYNKAGTFAGSADLTFDDVTNLLSVGGSIQASAGGVQVSIEDTDPSGTLSGGILGVSSNDGAAQAATDRLGWLIYSGHDGVSAGNPGAAIVADATELWGAGFGTELGFYTVPNGGTVLTKHAQLNSTGFQTDILYGMTGTLRVGNGGSTLGSYLVELQGGAGDDELLQMRRDNSLGGGFQFQAGNGDVGLYFTDESYTRSAGGHVVVDKGNANRMYIGAGDGSTLANSALLITDVNIVKVQNTTVSTSSTTGALQVAGGAGIAADTFIDGILGLQDANSRVVISQSATVGNSFGVGIGAQVTITGPTAVAIGYQASATNTNGVAVGSGASSSADSVVIGSGASGSGNDGVAIGTGADASHQSYVIGRAAHSTAGQQFVVGDDNNGRDVRNVYIGGGVTTPSPNSVTYHGTGGEGVDNAGANFSIAPGRSTGNVIGGYLQLRFAPAGTTGSTLNPLVSGLRVQGSAAAPAFTAAADADGIDVYIRGQDGGTHSVNNPRGGDLIIAPGAAGSGGAGRAGKVDIQSNLQLPGGLNWLGLTSTAADPTTTELPNDKDVAIHKNTSSGAVFLAYNDGSTIKKVALT